MRVDADTGLLSVSGAAGHCHTAAALATVLQRRRTINTDNRTAAARVTVQQSVSLTSAVDIIALEH